ncbi:MAG TPA: MauE/DoxX family redox-associated membrane protein [Parapedobacter sp.]|uniref:MauE/DoxX family redox-associated membrane protein n=1 Tax=Parapedobacter sp. TaxID=1958893 RepID=UPI002C27AD7F|nr:MauE/DoxX family redox-associated membrane protein [Parapedobacter sp.]HWK56345.1 MauE/DoxX family redox-associated membrane protein [Parapedobacter sp.]
MTTTGIHQEKTRVIEKKSILLGIIRLAFLALWVAVAVEKLWDLAKFHSTLRRQPIPEWSTDILFWLLPLAELGAAVLLAWPRSRKRTHHGMWLSAVLMLAFTLFILFGVLGWYEKRPCGCGSVISGLSWDNHLWFNAAFFLLAVLGVWLTWPVHGYGRRGRYRKPVRLFGQSDGASAPSGHFTDKLRVFVFPKHFPRKFAVFRRRALFRTLPCLYEGRNTRSPRASAEARDRNLHVSDRMSTTALKAIS